jgi:ABC-type dipeptide/oligopeptide/nickel transport system permease subunit
VSIGTEAELSVRSPGMPGGAGGADEIASLRGDTWRRLRKNKLAVAGLVIIAIVVLSAIFADVIATQPTEGFFADDSRLGPSMDHFFGTDELGRDIFSRVVHGARFSLIVGFSVVATILVVGLTIGGIAGYFGGIVDTILSRIIDIFLAFPYLVASIILVVALGGGQTAIIIALASLSWVTIARLFRGSVISIRNAEYVEAARALGAGHGRILLRHVLPNAVAPTLVYACALVGATIISEAALQFLGLGVTEPAASWGLMISRGRSFLTNEPHMVLFPSLALTMTVMGFVLLGDGLRDALDPRLR